MVSLKQQIRELRHEGGRVVMTTLGVVWGTLAVTVLVAFSASMSEAVMKGRRGLGEDIFVCRSGSTTRPFASDVFAAARTGSHKATANKTISNTIDALLMRIPSRKVLANR